MKSPSTNLSNPHKGSYKFFCLLKEEKQGARRLKADWN
jgi:hypothetical protein